MELSDLFEWPIVVGAIVIFFAGYFSGKSRARRENDLIGPPPGMGSNAPPPPPLPRRQPDGPPPRLAAELAQWAGLDPDTETAINDALAKGHKINAIKILREATGLGLKESKDAIDRLG